MTEYLAPSPSSLDRPRTFGWFALASALLSMLLLIGLLQPVPQTPEDLVAYVATHRAGVALQAVVVLTWAVVSIPFIAALGQLLRTRSSAFALSATILSSGGILMLAYGIRTYIGAILAIIAAGNPAYHAAIWRNLSFFLTDPGLMTWGLGQFLFGWLAWKSTAIPNWVAVVGMLGGLAGLLTDAVYQTGALALLQLLCFAIWGFTIGLMLVRGRIMG